MAEGDAGLRERRTADYAKYKSDTDTPKLSKDERKKLRAEKKRKWQEKK